MNKGLSFIILVMIFVALGCQSGESNEASAGYTDLEQQLEENPNLQNANALIQSYIDAAKDMTNASEREKILVKAAQTALDYKSLGQALGIIQRLVLDYPESDLTTQRLLQISQIFGALKRDEANAILLRTMAEKYPDHPDVKQAIISQNVPDLSPDSMIVELATQMFNDTLLQLNQPIARQYVDACEAFATVMQGDPRSAEYLHKGAETARSLQTIDKSLNLYDWIIERYPNHPRAAQSLFLKGFTLDNNLNQYEQAKVIYEAFLAKYPDNEFAESARFLIENLGKTDEELLQSLQEKGNQN